MLRGYLKQGAEERKKFGESLRGAARNLDEARIALPDLVAQECAA
jgi:hypothetical protein